MKQTRPPVIVVMGHIDHGKSTLLDYIRQSNVVAGEPGGITQKTSAYEIVYQDKKITFIDTPGHEAFAGMRTRGANIADIAVLVVSAEDGVKPQTREALAAIVAAELPYIVAINKIDRPAANVEKVEQELSEAGIGLEKWGGKIPAVAISAKTGENVNDLLDLLLLVAAVENLEGDPVAPASGFVLETTLDAKTGSLATIIIKNGTVRVGDFVAVGSQAGKIKKLMDFAGANVSELTMSAPAQIFGLAGQPAVGATFTVASTKDEAEKMAARVVASRPGLDEIPEPPPRPGLDVLPIILKADVAGALDALKKEVSKLENETTKFKIINVAAGAISEADIKLAASGSTHAMVLGFQTKIEKSARELAERVHVQVQTFDIIYKLTEWLDEEVKKLTTPVEIEPILGKAKILKLFSAEKNKQVIGGSVIEGKISDGKGFKIWRREAELGRGRIMGLQQQKLPAKIVEAGNQFGAQVESKIAIAAGDVLEVFDHVQAR